MAELTAFDIVVGLLVVLAALGGLARGFVGEVTSLLAWGAGIVAVRFGYGYAKPMATPYVSSDAGAAILAIVLLFLGAFIAVRVLGGGLSRTTKASVVGPVDRVLGLGFGAAKGVLAAVLLFLMTNLTFETIDPGEPSPDWLTGARTAPTLAILSRALVDFVEERRRIDSDVAGSADPHAGLDIGPVGAPEPGYDRDQRSAMEKLLDEQEQREPSTPI